MTPPEWNRKTEERGADPRRIVVLETLNGLTEVAFCPDDVAISHFDYDEADEMSRAGATEDAAHDEVDRARQRAGTILDERAAIDVLSECRELADRSDQVGLRDRIDEVLAPVTAFFSEDGQEVSFEGYRRRQRAEE